MRPIAFPEEEGVDVVFSVVEASVVGGEGEEMDWSALDCAGDDLVSVVDVFEGSGQSQSLFEQVFTVLMGVRIAVCEESVGFLVEGELEVQLRLLFLPSWVELIRWDQHQCLLDSIPVLSCMAVDGSEVVAELELSGGWGT